MGGPGSGGARAGAGAKKKLPRQRVLSGTATEAERELAKHPPPIIPVRRPLDLAGDEQATWDELSPCALAERTLTDSTAIAFRHLCEQIVMRKEIAKQLALDGLTIETPVGLKAHPLLTQYRGMNQRIAAGFASFRLAPFGKALFEDPRSKHEKGDGFDHLDDDDDDEDRDIN